MIGYRFLIANFARCRHHGGGGSYTRRKIQSVVVVRPTSVIPYFVMHHASPINFGREDQENDE